MVLNEVKRLTQINAKLIEDGGVEFIDPDIACSFFKDDGGDMVLYGTYLEDGQYLRDFDYDLDQAFRVDRMKVLLIDDTSPNVGVDLVRK